MAFFAAYAQTKVILANREKNRKLDAEIRQKNSELLGENHGFLQGGKTDFLTGIKSAKGKEIKLTDTVEMKINRGKEIDMKGVKNEKDGIDDRNRMKKGMKRNGCDSDKVTDGKHTAVECDHDGGICDAASISTDSIDTDAASASASDGLKSGLAYCFLPLPILTGLPIMVNGFFEPSTIQKRQLFRFLDLDTPHGTHRYRVRLKYRVPGVTPETVQTTSWFLSINEAQIDIDFPGKRKLPENIPIPMIELKPQPPADPATAPGIPGPRGRFRSRRSSVAQ